MASTSDTSILRKTRMTWKDFGSMVAIIVLLTGVVMSIVGWIHAEVTIPKILHQTAIQIKEAIEVHSKFSHPVSVPRREFDMLKTDLKEDLGRVESAVKEFKTENKTRLDRIEQKVDRL